MHVNSVTFRFTDVAKIADLEQTLDGGKLDLGNGTMIFLIDGQLAIQFFRPNLSMPTPEQKEGFKKALSLLENVGDLLATEEIK